MDEIQTHSRRQHPQLTMMLERFYNEGRYQKTSIVTCDSKEVTYKLCQSTVVVAGTPVSFQTKRPDVLRLPSQSKPV